MTTYTLYQMAYMIRLGIWNGGVVEKLGYFGAVEFLGEATQNYGLKGIQLSSNLMIENFEITNNSKIKIIVSIYDPYKGIYKLYSTCGKEDFEKPEIFWQTVRDITQGVREKYVWSHNINKNNIYNIERQYDSSNRSIRSGAVQKPRKSKIFNQ